MRFLSKTMDQAQRDQLKQEFEAPQGGAAYLQMPRTTISIEGADRKSFLHNLCTNDIVKLTPGTGCEAFLCNVQGKILGHVFVTCQEESLLLDAEPGLAQSIMDQLDKYLITEDVQLEDVSAGYATLAVVGAEATAFVASHILPDVPDTYMEHRAVEIGSAKGVLIYRCLLQGSGDLLLRILAEDAKAVVAELESKGAVATTAQVAESLRVARGIPRYGIDITEKNLPQEVGRDAATISFTKGCYLGQETVARIDAMGHVNWHLVRLQLHGDSLVTPETEIVSDEKVVGRITSCAWFPQDGSVRAIGYLRREAVEKRPQLTTNGISATMVV